MKGRYTGAMMNIYGSTLPGAIRLARFPVNISSQAKQRLRWFDYHHKHNNVRLVCRYFGIPPKTFYKWHKRFKKLGIRGLDDVSRKPKRFRQSQVPLAWIALVKQLRTKYPYYSKYKLMVILKRDYDIIVSPSTIGRIIVKYQLFFSSPIKPKRLRHRAVVKQRLPKDFKLTAPGDLVETDTKHVYFFGLKRYFFVGIDCFTKRLAVHIGTTPSSKQASILLDEINHSFPYSVIRIRNDNGSENLKDFAKKAQEYQIKQYFTYPNCPKDKPFVERVIGTIERECIQQGKLAFDLEDQRQLITEWLNEYHTFRPHQALNYLTPFQFEEKLQLQTSTNVLPM